MYEKQMEQLGCAASPPLAHLSSSGPRLGRDRSWLTAPHTRPPFIHAVLRHPIKRAPPVAPESTWSASSAGDALLTIRVCVRIARAAVRAVATRRCDLYPRRVLG